MQKRELENRGNSGLTRRQWMIHGLMAVGSWVVEPFGQAFGAIADDMDEMSRIPRLERRDDPLLVLQAYESDQDREIERHLRRQMASWKDVLRRVQQKIGFEKHVRLSIEQVNVRLLFIPQSRETACNAYFRYCKDIVATIFQINRTASFYSTITRPDRSFPTISDTGITAFLVHRLAKEFEAVCKFTAESGKSIKYTASGAIYSNHLGAVDLEIQNAAPGKFTLTRKPLTIWQNDTANLYTLMAIPIEETLHYLLGVATDREIAHAMQIRPPLNLIEARALAEEWMAVEDSIVGGVVDRLLGMYCARHGISISVLGKVEKCDGNSTTASIPVSTARTQTRCRHRLPGCHGAVYGQPCSI